MYLYENRNREAYRCYRGTVPPETGHFHSQAELCLVLSGNISLTVCENSYEAQTGDVLVLFPYQAHRYSGGGEVLQLNVDHRLTPEYHKAFTELWPASPLISSQAELPVLRRLQDKLPELYGCRRDDPYGEIALRGCLIAVWGEVLSALRLQKSTTRADFGLFQSAVQYCIENYNDPSLTLGRAAKELNINRAYLSTLFGRSLGCGFHTYLNHLRIVRACYIIAEEKSSVTEAAFASGFANLRTFNRVFLKQAGMTPTVYRKSSSGNSYTLAPPSENMPF